MVALAAVPAAAEGQAFSIDGQSNIFGAGHLTAPAPGGRGPGRPPLLIRLPAGGERTLSFSQVRGGIVTGSTSCETPDSCGFGTSNIASAGGIAGLLLEGTGLPLVGVFLTGAEPTGPGPPRLDFRATGLGLAFTALRPGIAQVFYIGDGQASAGVAQAFTAPAGATRLYLGLADAAGFQGQVCCYEDNVGTISGRVSPGPPPPQLGRAVNVRATKGPVFVSLPVSGARAAQKGRRFVPLEEARQIPVGSLLDTRRGEVRLVSARNTAGATQAGRFSGSVFQVLQRRSAKRRGLTELRLTGGKARRCPAAAAAARRRIRRLRGNARGRFRTRGRHSAATVRGTIWTMTDRCDGTLTRVRRGSVVVRDFRRARNVVVRAGKSYLARAR